MAMSFRIEAGSKGYGFMSYQPNLVALKFSLSQMLPKSLVSHSTDIVWDGRQLNFKGHKACLKFHKSTQCLKLPVFKFQQSFLTTKDFDRWWFEYQRQCFPSAFFLQNMIDAFSALVGETLVPQPNIDAPIEKIQTIDVEEAQTKKVTPPPSLFLSLRSKIKTIFCSLSLFSRVKSGLRFLCYPQTNLQKGKKCLQLQNHKYFAS